MQENRRSDEKSWRQPAGGLNEPPLVANRWMGDDGPDLSLAKPAAYDEKEDWQAKARA
jgi:hypothetical protein